VVRCRFELDKEQLKSYTKQHNQTEQISR
jgi:hypothetical protein